MRGAPLDRVQGRSQAAPRRAPGWYLRVVGLPRPLPLRVPPWLEPLSKRAGLLKDLPPSLKKEQQWVPGASSASSALSCWWEERGQPPPRSSRARHVRRAERTGAQRCIHQFVFFFLSSSPTLLLRMPNWPCSMTGSSSTPRRTAS